MQSAYIPPEVRRLRDLAKRLIDENRVPTDALLELILEYGDEYEEKGRS